MRDLFVKNILIVGGLFLFSLSGVLFAEEVKKEDPKPAVSPEWTLRLQEYKNCWVEAYPLRDRLLQCFCYAQEAQDQEKREVASRALSWNISRLPGWMRSSDRNSPEMGLLRMILTDASHHLQSNYLTTKVSAQPFPRTFNISMFGKQKNWVLSFQGEHDTCMLRESPFLREFVGIFLNMEIPLGYQCVVPDPKGSVPTIPAGDPNDWEFSLCYENEDGKTVTAILSPQEEGDFQARLLLGQKELGTFALPQADFVLNPKKEKAKPFDVASALFAEWLLCQNENSAAISKGGKVAKYTLRLQGKTNVGACYSFSVEATPEILSNLLTKAKGLHKLAQVLNAHKLSPDQVAFPTAPAEAVVEKK